MRIFKGIPHNLELAVIDETGAFVPGLTIGFDIRRCSDNVSIESGNLSEVPPAYVHTTTIPVVGEYRVIYTAPVGYESGFETLIVDDYADYKADVSLLALESTAQSIQGQTNLIPAQPAAIGDEMSLTAIERAQIVDALLNTVSTIETGVSVRTSLRALLATLAGVATGGGTVHVAFKNPAGTTPRVDMTVDVDGNRSNVSLHG